MEKHVGFHLFFVEPLANSPPSYKTCEPRKHNLVTWGGNCGVSLQPHGMAPANAQPASLQRTLEALWTRRPRLNLQCSLSAMGESRAWCISRSCQAHPSLKRSPPPNPSGVGRRANIGKDRENRGSKRALSLEPFLQGWLTPRDEKRTATRGHFSNCEESGAPLGAPWGWYA